MAVDHPSMDHETLKRRTLGSVLWMVAASGWASIASFVTFAIWSNYGYGNTLFLSGSVQ
jgi:hypothetical protein